MSPKYYTLPKSHTELNRQFERESRGEKCHCTIADFRHCPETKCTRKLVEKFMRETNDLYARYAYAIDTPQQFEFKLPPFPPVIQRHSRTAPQQVERPKIQKIRVYVKKANGQLIVEVFEPGFVVKYNYELDPETRKVIKLDKLALDCPTYPLGPNEFKSVTDRHKRFGFLDRSGTGDQYVKVANYPVRISSWDEANKPDEEYNAR